MTKEEPKGFPGDADFEDVDPEVRKLLEQPEPEGWKPEVGDSVTGTVLEIDEAGQGSAFGTYPLLTVEKPSGELVALHCFHTMLKTRVERAKANGKLREGSRIGVTYEGPAEGGNYGSFERYRFVVLPAAASPSA